MDLNKFTEKSHEALVAAQSISARLQHQSADVEHLMIALFEAEGGLVPSLFEKAKIAPDLLRSKVEAELARIPRVPGDSASSQGIHVTQRLNKVRARSSVFFNARWKHCFRASSSPPRSPMAITSP